METFNKQLIFNTTVMTLFLSLGLAWIGVQIQGKTDIVGVDSYLTFMVLFLVLLPYHFIVSLYYYGVSRLIKNIPLRLILFNGTGSLLLFILWSIQKDVTVFIAASSFIIISGISQLFTYRRRANHKSS